ncbi:Response regulator PleD [Paenibacillus konkukensis]|uniref:Response regulator PleD n=2 Tax=Paenibacillus konkukensis TaxID=2020716 RepID=A0ABY4RVW1_9BACL|nr:Response regulator PleD [Paenibacillus konkukensis]
MSFVETVPPLMANFATVTAYLLLTNRFLLKKSAVETASSLFTKFKIGFVHGILGIVLMIFTVHVHGATLDFRQLAVILSGVYGGLASSLITGVMMFAVKLVAFGSLIAPSEPAAINIIFIAAGVGMICEKVKGYWPKWIYSLLLSVLLTGFFYSGKLVGSRNDLALIYFPMMVFGGAVTAYFTELQMKVKTHVHRLELESSVDFLTGLHNHRMFDSIYHQKQRQAVEKGASLSIAIIDVDYFKKVNDSYGHANGDAVLVQLGAILKASSRSDDTISRLGGEEFSVLMYDTPNKDALRIAERIRVTVKNHLFVLNDGEKIHITVSIGVATYPDTSHEKLAKEADKALYRAKEQGRDRVCSNLSESGEVNHA